MPFINIPDSWKCQRCGDAVVKIHWGHSLYCGENCALHDEVYSYVYDFLRIAKEGRGGSPEAIEVLDTITEHLHNLKPIRPDQCCEYCWSPMMTAPSKPDSAGRQVMVVRCPNCGRELSMPPPPIQRATDD